MLELRIAQDRGNGAISIDGVKLAEPGVPDEGPAKVALLAQLKLDATVGSDALEVNPSGDVLATVNGQHYVVGLAVVRHRDGRFDDSLVFFGMPTEVAPAEDDDVSA